MQYGRVCGTVVSTLKHEALNGYKMLLVQPFDVHGKPAGQKILALDVVDAGPDDWVLLLDEGSSASSVSNIRVARSALWWWASSMPSTSRSPRRRVGRRGNRSRHKGLTALGAN